MPLYPPCHLLVLSVLVFLTPSCDKKWAIRDFINTLDDPGERERERLPFLSFSDGGCVFKIANKTNEANQTWIVL